MVYVIVYRQYEDNAFYDPMGIMKVISVCTTLETARNELDRLTKELRETVSNKYGCKFPELKPEDYFKEKRGVQYSNFMDGTVTEYYTIVETELKGDL